MRYAPDRKEQTRNQLLVAAAATLRSEGPDRVSVASLMKGCGLTHGGFYAHFESKEQMILFAIDEMFEQSYALLHRQTDPLLGEAESDRAALVQALLDYAAFYLSRGHVEARSAGCPLPAIAADAQRLGPEARGRFMAGSEKLFTRLAEVIQRLGVDGSDAWATAVSLYAELSGAVTLARTMGSADMEERVLTASLASITRKISNIGVADDTPRSALVRRIRQTGRAGRGQHRGSRRPG